MKYTTTLKSALALAMGLVVGTASAVTTTQSDVQSYADTFDTYAAGLKIGDAANNATFRDMEAETGWFVGSADDESAISNRTDAAGNMLWLNTEASTLSNKFTQAVATELNAGIADKGAYFESDIKFVASDTLDPGITGGTDDAKFAIYAYCKDDGMPTNLVVYHGFFDLTENQIVYTNEVFSSVDIDVSVYTKIRVNIKQIDEGGQPLNLLTVSVNNGPCLTSTTAYQGDCWFLTTEAISDSENQRVAALTFTGTGEIDNIKAGVITETTAYTVDWTGSDNVVVSNATEAIASSPTNLPACTLTFYPTEGNQITNVLVGGVAQAFDPAAFVLNVSSDTNVVVLAGVQASPATVISVATVGNATVTDSDGTYTITIPEGNSLSSVFVNGAAVDPSLLTDNQDGTYTLDLTDADGTVNVVVAATKTRTPIGHKWYENPTIVGSLKHDIKGLNGAGYAPWHLGGDVDVVAGTAWTGTSGEMKAFDINDVIESSGSAIASNVHAATAGTWGAAVSKALNVALVGSDTGNNKAIAYPLDTYNGTIDVDSFIIENDIGIGFNDAAFTADGQYLYANCYRVSGDNNRNYIYKFRVLNGLKTSGVNLQFVEKYNMGDRVRSIALGEFQGGDVVYALLDNKKVVYFDTTSAETEATELISGYAPVGIYGDIIVSRADPATPHITIIGASTERINNVNVYHYSLDVYTLTAAGTALASQEPLISWNDAEFAAHGFSAGSGNGLSGFITEDEETFIFTWGTTTFYAIQYVEPPTPTVISIALVGGASYTDADGVLTFTAPTGSAITSIYTNGVDTGSTTTFTTNGLTGTVNVVAAATKTRAAPEHKWWENPGVVGITASGLSNESTYGLRYMNGAGDFVAATGWNSNRKVKGYDLDDLIAGNAEAIITNEYPTTAGTWGVAISPALNVLLVGENYNGKKLISYPLNEAGVVGENAYLIETDNNTVHGLQDMEFTADNRYLYALDYETRYVYKYQVLNGLKSDGTNLVRVATYDFGDDLPAGGIGAIGVGQFQGGDVIYAMIRNTGVIKYIDTSAPTVVNTLNASAPIGGWGDIMVSAADTATPRITIIGCKMGYDDKSLEVYTLNATGTAVVGEPLLSLDGPALRGIGLPNANTYGYSGFITPDEATFVFGWNNTLCAIQYLEPQYTATYTGSENVIITNTYDGSSYQWGEGEAVVPTQIACLTGTVLSFYPTEGNVITNVTIGGVEQTGFDPACYSITVISDTNLVVLAGVQASAADDYEAGDTVGAETLNADVAAWLNTKKGTATKVEFEKTLDEDEFTLTEEYLLNTDPTVDTTVEFKISSITVGSTVDLQVTLTRTEGNEAVASAINGTLKIKGAAAVNGSYTVEQTLTDKFNGATTATKSFSTENKFFKAVIE